ncbi:MAG TPA: PDZ domain-containing protein [Bryobacteraceae bacterium]|nr:PDZ domain-containing protein [Bryobacteraceae bacterium]
MNRIVFPSLCFAFVGVTAASGLLAQDTAPRARSATNRAIVIRNARSSYLGIGVAEIDAERAKALNLKEVHGVEVKSVDSDSPAAKAGLKEGDVVLEYNGQRIEGTEQFVRLVHETPVDRQVRLQVWHNGASETLTAAIGHRNDRYSFNTDWNNQDFTVEMPPMPPMPEVPPLPDAPPMPDWPRAMTMARTGMLGIECEAVGSQLAGYFGVKEGVLVRSVAKESVAEKAGIRAGDVIVKVDGEAVTSVHEVTSLVRAARTKHSFPVVVVRDKKETTLTITVESGSRGMRPVSQTGRWC